LPPFFFVDVFCPLVLFDFLFTFFSDLEFFPVLFAPFFWAAAGAFLAAWGALLFLCSPASLRARPASAARLWELSSPSARHKEKNN
jgi:hypothetical protein